MAAFKGAVKVGAHAIETDIHLTKDNIVVLSHVRTLWNLLYFYIWFSPDIYYRILHWSGVLEERTRSLT